jgi:hypothetical protein
LRQVESLRGKRLGCYCRLSSQTQPACHADNYIRILEGLGPPEPPAIQGSLFD